VLGPFDYSPVNSTAGVFLGTFVFKSNQLFPGCCGVDENRLLNLGFVSPLTNAGGTVTLAHGQPNQSGGSECLNCNPFRIITGGSATASGLSLPTVSFSRRDVAAGSAALSMTTADFNSDGKADVVLVTVPGWGVSVLLGHGDGTFDPPRPVSIGVPRAGSVVAADFNGDGRMDLAVTNLDAHTVSIALGLGDGTFSAARQFSAGTWPTKIVAADFNGDGKVDLAMTNFQGLVPGIAGTSITVLLGEGDGTFGPPLPSPVIGTRPNSLAAGEFNSDGKIDLIVTSSEGQISVLTGKGDGTFQAPRLVASFIGGAVVEVADFNLDGQADIAVLRSSISRASVMLGNGNGSFRSANESVLDGSEFSVADINGDGIPDLAAVNSTYSAAVVLVGRGDGTFEDEVAFSVLPGPVAFVVGDFNGDGAADLVVECEANANLTVLLNSTPRPRISPNGVVNAASSIFGPLAPGEIVTIFGNNLGPQQMVTARLQTPDFLDTVLDGTRVLFDGVPAPLIYARADQVSAVVPYSLSGKGSTRLQVAYGQTRTPVILLPVTPTNPGIFTADSSGSGPVVAVNQDGTLNSPANPAAKGSLITFFATGEGQTNPPGVDGKIATAPLPVPALPVIVGIANMGAETTYVGAAPGLISGLLQINARVPPDAFSGPRVPLVILVGAIFSQPGVTVAIQ
jgi:uncharacterized protein (TIGR03437 family)